MTNGEFCVTKTISINFIQWLAKSQKELEGQKRRKINKMKIKAKYYQ